MWRTISGLGCLAVIFGLLSGCGGSSSSAAAGGGTTGGTTGGTSGGTSGSSGSGGGGSQTIQGIATPSSVSVVTANNAN